MAGARARGVPPGSATIPPISGPAAARWYTLLYQMDRRPRPRRQQPRAGGVAPFVLVLRAEEPA